MSEASFRLIVRTGPNPGMVFELTKEVTLFGRDVTNDIVLADAEVSRQHARLTHTPGGYVLEDLGSTNGSFVNGERLVAPRTLNPGDLVGFDTDMIGPFGYFADISRTVHCGPARPTRRQRELYQLAVDEITHNLQLIRPGLRFSEFQELAYPVPEEFQAQAYTCAVHAVGMCDEYPRINPNACL